VDIFGLIFLDTETGHFLHNFFFLIGIVGGGVLLGPLGTAATNRHIVPAPGDYYDGEIGEMIGRGNRNTRRKPAPVPLCPPHTPHAFRKRNRAAAMGFCIIVQLLKANLFGLTLFYNESGHFRTNISPY
jgi:hypothetical protein